MNWRGRLLASLGAHGSGRKPLKDIGVKSVNGFGGTHQGGRGHGKATDLAERQARLSLSSPYRLNWSPTAQLISCSSVQYFKLFTFGFTNYWKLDASTIPFFVY